MALRFQGTNFKLHGQDKVLQSHAIRNVLDLLQQKELAGFCFYFAC